MTAIPAIAYAPADLSPQRRGRVLCGVLSLLLAIISLLCSGFVGLGQGVSVWATQRSVTALPGQAARINQQRLLMQRNAAATAWLNQQASHPPPLPTDAQVNDLIAALNRNSTALNPAQIQTLSQALRQPGQQLFDSTLPYTVGFFSSTAPSGPRQLVSATTRPGSQNATIVFRHDESFGPASTTTLRLDTQGKCIDQRVNNIAANAANFARYAPVAGGTSSSSNYASTLNLRRWYGVASLTATALNFALAITLLLAAIAALQKRPSWPRLHRQYAMAKLIMVPVTTFCIYWTFGFGRDAIDLKIAGVYALAAGLYPLSLLMRLR